mmetsp:Transcript_34687/g.89662  ORF Transcript_34687/g.89662 Transcript_34687/m.89662 type:complete len:246 (-) Transcript_34687:2-739(-)
MLVLRRTHRRRDAHRILQVRVCAILEQFRTSLHVTGTCRPGEWRVSGVRAEVGVTLPLQQQLQDRHATLCSRQADRRYTPWARCGVDLGAAGDQQPRNLQMAAGDRHHQRRQPVVIATVRLRVSDERKHGPLHVSTCTRIEEILRSVALTHDLVPMLELPDGPGPCRSFLCGVGGRPPARGEGLLDLGAARRDALRGPHALRRRPPARGSGRGRRLAASSSSAVAGATACPVQRRGAGAAPAANS